MSVVRDDDDWRIDMLESGAVKHPVTFALDRIDAQVDLIRAQGRIPAKQNVIFLVGRSYRDENQNDDDADQERSLRIISPVERLFVNYLIIDAVGHEKQDHRMQQKDAADSDCPDELVKLH